MPNCVKFCDYQCNFLFLLQFLFVCLMYYTFCCVVSLIYWFLNRLFHETLVNQNFGKAKLFYLNLYPSFWFLLFQSFILQTNVYNWLQISFFQWWLHHYSIMTWYSCCCDLITMNLSFFLLQFLIWYIVLVLVFPIDISFYDVLRYLSSEHCIFAQFLDVIEPHSQVKRPVNYVYSERTFYWLSYPFYKTQKTVFVFEK